MARHAGFATLATACVSLCVVVVCSATLAAAQARCGTAENPGLSCSDIYDAGGSVGDGVYRVRAPDGTTHSVYCDMEGGGLQLVAKMRWGDDGVFSNQPDYMDDAWLDGTVNHGEDDPSRMNPADPTTGHYFSRFRRCWNTADCTVEDVVVQVMVGGQSKKALVFDGTGTTNANFFRASSLRASSWYDLTSSAFAGNYFSMAGHIELQRHFFINERYGGCGNDWGWLISASGTTCSWESSRNAAPALLFSDATNYVNVNGAEFKPADTFAFFVKFSHPTTAGHKPCTVAGTSMQLLTGGGAFNRESGQVIDRTDNGNHGTGASRLATKPAPWDPSDEVGVVRGSGFVWIDTPQNIRLSGTAAAKMRDQVPPQVDPAERPTAIVANVHTFQDGDRDDWVTHAFGRNVDDAVFNSVGGDYFTYTDPAVLNGYWNDVVLTHHGQGGGHDHYGHSHGTQIIPLKDNFKFDVYFGMGKKDANGHYVTIQVIGYFIGDITVPADEVRGNNIIIQHTAQNVQDPTAHAALSMLDADTRGTARAVIASVYTFFSPGSDHMVHSFGRDNTHTGSSWDNTVYSNNIRYNDIMLSHEGDSAYDYNGGFWHGTQIVPLLPDGSFRARLGMGKNAASGTSYIVLQQYGFLNGVASMLSAPSNLRFHINTRNVVVNNIQPPVTVPDSATAILVSITTFDDKRGDHMTHTFGRYTGHQDYTWDNAPYTVDGYLNDVYVTHEGDASGDGYYYGHSHGTSIIPLKADGTFDAKLGGGYNAGSTANAWVTLQVYGYINAVGKGGSSSPAIEVPTAPTSSSFTTSAFFHRNAEGRSAPFGIGRLCKGSDNTACTWELQSDAGGTSVRARISFDGAGARGLDDWDFVVPTDADEWHHVALVFDATKRLATFVVDGTPYLAPLGTAGDEVSTVGMEVSYGTSGAGELHDLRVYDYAITEAQANSLWLSYARMRHVNDVLLWWRLTEGSGSLIHDASRRGLLGAYVGSSMWQANGMLGPFGTDEVVSAGNVGLSGDPAMTLAAWVRSDTTPSGRQHIMGLRTADASGTIALGVSDGRPSLDFGHAGLVVRASSSGDLITRGRWHHVAATRSPGPKLATTKLYLDGRQVATELSGGVGVPGRDDAPVLVDSQWVVGRTWTGSPTWNGFVYDARVYARALTVDEITTTVYGSALAVSWSMRDDVGTRIPDHSPSGAYWTTAPATRTLGDEGLVRLTAQSYVESRVALGLDGDHELSVCAWAFYDSATWSTGDTISVIAALRPRTTTAQHGAQLAMGVQRGQLVVDFGNGLTLISAGPTLPTQAWFHTCVTRTTGFKSTNTRAFVDGSEVTLQQAAEDMDDRPLNLNAASVLTVGAGGALAQPGSRTLIGYVDTVQLYRRALSTADVVAIRQASLAPHARNLAMRAAGNGNHLDRTGGTSCGGPLTIELWVKAVSPSRVGQGLLDTGDAVGLARFYVALSEGTGRMVYSVDNTNPGSGTSGSGSLTTPTSFPSNLWTHVVVSHAASGHVSVYWAGTLQVTGELPVPLEHVRDRFLVGRLLSESLSVTFHGVIDSVALWTGAFTPDELLAAAGTKSTSTQVWYDFELATTRRDPRVFSTLDLEDRVVSDRSPNGFHARLECTGVCLVRAPSPAPVCGDGYKQGAEVCDDGNLNAGDGCSKSCTIETGYVCFTDGVFEASVCERGTYTLDEGFEGEEEDNQALDWQFLAYNPGSDKTQVSYFNGGNFGGSSYTDCRQFRHWGSHYIMRVEMGRTVDYYRPDGEYDVCAMAQQLHPNQKRLWSPTPWGRYTRFNYYGAHFGGSRSGDMLSVDGRQYLSFWGDPGINGGCCQMNNLNTLGPGETLDNPRWGLPFTLSVAQDTTREDEWVEVLSADGSQPVYPSHYSSGAATAGVDAKRSCVDFQGWGSGFMIKVVMGSVTDYFQPNAAGKTVCSVLTAQGNHIWSSHEHGPFVAMPFYGSHLGGCQNEWPYSSGAASLGVNNDGRRYISFFGTGQGGTERGGCCHAKSLDDTGTVDIATWDQPFTVYVKKMRSKPFCNTVMDGGGWALVRRISASNNWFSCNDAAQGSCAQWVYQPDPQHPNYEFGRLYDTLPYTTMLFTTGDGAKFVVASRADVARVGGETAVTILRSHKKDYAYASTWLHRSGQPEDPWIAADVHGLTSQAGQNDGHSMIYGENGNSAWTYYRQNHKGANVYVRNTDVCPLQRWMFVQPTRGAAEVVPSARALGASGLRLEVQHKSYMSNTGYSHWAHGTVLLSTSAGSNTHLHIIASVRKSVGAETSPLIITVHPDWVVADRMNGPTACEPNCKFQYYRVCVNPGPAMAGVCDEVLQWEHHIWMPLRLHLQSKWLSKYPGTTLPRALGVQVASYAKVGEAEAWVDDVASFESEGTPPPSCQHVRARSSRGDPSKLPSCLAHKAYNADAPSGVYTINPSGGDAPSDSFQVYCKMDGWDGGGWVVFQRRRSAAVDFYRGWADYKNGFGQLADSNGGDSSNLWLGLDKVYRFTSNLPSKAWWYLYSKAANEAWEYKWNGFRIEPESDQYRLRLSNAVIGHSQWDYHNNNQFNTKDSGAPGCSNAYKGGWWYGGCHYMNYNGLWADGNTGVYAQHISDYQRKGYYFSVSNVDMMMRETNNPNYEYSEAQIYVDGVDYSTTAKGLQVVSPPLTTGSMRHHVSSLSSDGTAFKSFVDSTVDGAIVAGAVRGDTAAGPLAEAWVTALTAIGVDAPIITVRMLWTFVGKKGAPLGTGQSNFARGASQFEVDAQNWFSCPTLPSMAAPDNRARPAFPIQLQQDAPADVVLGMERMPVGSPVTVDGATKAVVSRYGGVLNARLVPSMDLILNAYKPLASSSFTFTSQSGVASFKQIAHNYGYDAAPLRAVVRLRVKSGPNAGFVFGSAGSSMYNDGGSHTYGGVVLGLGQNDIRLWAPSGVRDGGHIVNVGIGWGQEKNAQAAHEADLSVEVHRLGGAAFDSGWFDMSSQQGTSSYKEVTHGLGSTPGRVRVLVKAVDGSNQDYVFEAWGSQQVDDDAPGNYGGLIYAYDTTTVRLWAPDASNGHSNGFIVNVASGWAGTKFAQSSHNAKVRVMVWRDVYVPSYTSTWVTMAVNAASSYREFKHNLGRLPAAVQVRVRATGGNNVGYMFEGASVCQGAASSGVEYGGVVYAYDETYVRVWAPSVDPSSTKNNGRIIAVWDGWGGEVNYANAVDAEVQVRVWEADPIVAADRASLHIDLHPVNKAPTMQDTSMELAYSAVPGSVVTTVQASDSDGDALSYTIIGGNVGGAFGLDRRTGRIMMLDETAAYSREVFGLEITVSDGIMSDSGMVTIRTPTENRPPKIDEGMVIEVREGASVGSDVGAPLNATDPDVGTRILFEIVAGDGDGTFKVDVCTGQVRVKAATIDYETKSSYTIRVRVSDDAEPPLWAEADVTINVIDSNDPPACSPSQRFVPEHAAVGDNVGPKLEAVDTEGDNLSWRIRDGNQRGLLAINATSGQLTVAQLGLDYETNAAFNITVTAADDGEGFLECTTYVTIRVSDSNDPPSLADSSLSVDENSPDNTLIATMRVLDQDAGDTATVVFASDSLHMDVFNLTQGRLFVRTGASALLDFETTPEYTLKFEVTDNGGPEGPGAAVTVTESVVVAVRNVNDAPTLTVVRGTIAEDAAVGDVVLTAAGGQPLTAADEDVGDVLEFLTESTSDFSVDPVTGHIVLGLSAELDFETKPEWTMDVTVRDDGSPRLSTTAVLSIDITDANDAPVFTCTEGLRGDLAFPGYTAVRALVAEGAPLDISLFDFGTKASYAACSAACYAVSGARCTAWTMYAATYYDSNVAGKCMGRALGRTDMAKDTADAYSAEVIKLCRSMSVTENTAVGTSIGSIAATDQDGQGVTFTIVSGVSDDGVALSSAGELTVGSAGVDYERADAYYIVVSASDGVGGVTETHVRVVIADVDEPPVFENSAMDVPQGATAGTDVGSALPGYDPEGVTLTYAFVSGQDGGGAFVLDGSVIKTTRLINDGPGATFSLQITASDASLSTTATIVVTVVEGNVPPVVADQARSVPENSPVGTAVGVALVVSDDDVGDTHTWSIVPSGDTEALAMFSIGANTGIISVARADLDFERKTTYTLTVRARDSAAGAAEATVTITVTDVNEVPSCPDRVFTRAENLDTASAVVLDAAYACSDPDGDSLTFTLDTAGVSGGRFTVTKTGAATATLAVAAGASLNFEAKSSYEMVLAVSDGRGGDITPSVNVLITDVNEAPTITHAGLSGGVVVINVPESEMASAGRSLIQLGATDPDGNALAWSITDVVGGLADPTATLDRTLPDVFRIDAALGDIRLQADASLDFEDVEAFHITVVATDGQLSDTVQVRVLVTDVNDVTVVSVASEGSGITDINGMWLMDTAGTELALLSGKNFGPTAAKITQLEAMLTGGESLAPPAVVASYGTYSTTCEVLTPNTVIRCGVVPGVGKGHAWAVSVDGVVASVSATAAYIGPNVLAAVVTGHSGGGSGQLPTGGATSVTITGQFFGPAGGQLKAWYRAASGTMYAATACTVTVADTEATCKTVAGVGTALSWQVEVGAQRSAWLSTDMRYMSPAVTSAALVSGTSLSSKGATVVAIAGSNFGPATLSTVLEDANGARTAATAPAPQVVASYRSAGLPGVALQAACTVHTAHSALRCTTVAGAGASLLWTVVVNGQPSGEFASSVSYEAPVVTGVAGPGPFGGATSGNDAIRVLGTGFGPVLLNAVDWVKYGVTGVEYTATGCSVTSSGIQDEIQCLTAPGTGSGHKLTMQVAGQAAALYDHDGYYARPVITDFTGAGSADANTAGGQEVVIKGSNFGFADAVLGTVTYSREVPGGGEPKVYEAVSCSITLAHTEITCQSAAGAGTDLAWTVMIDGQESVSPVTWYAKPHVGGLVWKDAVVSSRRLEETTGNPFIDGASTDGAQRVRLYGANFGTNDHIEGITYGTTGSEYTLRNIDVIDHTYVEGDTSAGIGSNLKFIVRVEGQTSDRSTATLSYAAPSIEDIWVCPPGAAKCHKSLVVPTHSPDGSPTIVELRGRNFGLRDPNADVHVILGNDDDKTLLAPLPTTYRFPTPSTTPYTPGSQHVVRFALPSGIAAARAVRVAVFPVGQPSFAVPSAPALLNYADPVLKYVEVTPANRTLSEAFFPGQDVLRLVVHGYNFGTAADVNGDEVVRRVWIEEHDPSGTLVANFSAGSDVVHILEWSNDATGHNETVVFTPVRYGAVKMSVDSVDPFGAAVQQVTTAASYADFSPRVSNLDSAGLEWLTQGGELLTMQVQYLGSTQVLWITVGGNGTRCPLAYTDTKQAVPEAEMAAYLEDLRQNRHDGGDTPGPSTLWTVSCLVPPGEGEFVGVSVVRDGLPGAPYFIKYRNPSVDAVAVRHPWEEAFSTTTVADAPAGWVIRSATQGSRMRITGNNFGLCPVLTFGGEPVEFCGANAQPGANRSHTTLLFTVPAGEGYGFDPSLPYRLELDVAGQAPVLGYFNFAYLSPVVEKVSPVNGTTRGNTMITVTGKNFGVYNAGDGTGQPTVTVGGRPCTDVVQTSHSRLTCKTPAGTGLAREVVVTAKAQSGMSTQFGYNTPVIASVTSTDASTRIEAGVLRGPTAGGFNITITGVNFGTWDDPNFCVNVLFSGAGATPSCGAASAPMPSTFHPHVGILPNHLVYERDHDRIVFVMPSGMGRRDIAVVVNGQVAVRRRVFQYNSPVITSLDPSAGGTNGGQIVTITGKDLGNGLEWPQLVYMRVNFFNDCVSNATTSTLAVPTLASPCSGKGAQQLVSHTHTSIVFKTRPGIGVNRSVSVEIDDSGERITSNELMFHYHPPTVDVLFPNPVAMDLDPSRLVVKGTNYGREADEASWTAAEKVVEITVHGEVCEGAKRVKGENGQLECSLTPTHVGHKHVNITVASQRGSLADSSDSALFMVCKIGFYGQPDEVCEPCPQGAVCDGFSKGFHAEPRSLPGWFNLNGSLDTCSDIRKQTYGVTREHCAHVVPCEPKAACLGDNKCAVGYVSKPPMHRCSSCNPCYKANPEDECQAFYRRAGECIECPKNPWILIGAFIIMAICLCAGGYILNRKAVNLAFVSIGVDYFQVLAMFANSKITWPPAIKEMFHIFSVFNLNLEITAPECSIPDLGYQTKWFFIEALPLAASGIFLLLHVMLWFKKRCILGRKKKTNTHVDTLIGMLLVMFYYLYLYLSRTVLDVFNCSPTDPPDGHEYLEVIFERCWEAGGTQMTLLPFALIALLLYVIGYPAVVWLLLKRNKMKIMEDQLLRAKGLGKTRLENPHAYEVRKRLHKIYYHFRPDYWYWILCVIARKFFIAFTALMFNKNPAFQLSIALLVMFACYAMQVKHQPYMSPSEHAAVVKQHEDAAREPGSVHNTLASNLLVVERGLKKKTRMVDQWGSVQRRKEERVAAERAAAFFFDYNTVEATLLASAVLVNLAGVMFESNRFQSDYYETQRDLITYWVMIVIGLSIAYFGVVFGSEVYITTCAKPSGKKKKKGKKGEKELSTSRRGLTSPSSRMDPEAATTDAPPGMTGGNQEAGLNPMFLKMQKEADAAAAESKAVQPTLPAGLEVGDLLQENLSLKTEVQRLQLEMQALMAGRTKRRDAGGAGVGAARRQRAVNKNEFRQQRAGTRAGGRRGKKSLRSLGQRTTEHE